MGVSNTLRVWKGLRNEFYFVLSEYEGSDCSRLVPHPDNGYVHRLIRRGQGI